MAATTPSPTVTNYGAFGPNTETELESVFLVKESGTGSQTISGAVTFAGAVTNQGNTTQSAGTFALATAANGLTGNGNNQTAGTPITAAISAIQTCNANNNAFLLPVAAAGMQLLVINNTAAAANIYPALNGTINQGAANAVYSLAANNQALLSCPVAGAWFAIHGT